MFRKVRTLLCVALLNVSGCLLSHGQKLPDNTVNLNVTVKTKKGDPIVGLDATNFTILEGEEIHPVSYVKTDEPMTIGFMIDVSRSMNKGQYEPTFRALIDFINASNPTNQYLVMTFNDEVGFTNLGNASQTINTINRLPTFNPKRTTALYDSLLFGIQKLSTGTFNKKALIVFTDGQDNTSKTSFSKLKEILKGTNTLLFMVVTMNGNDATLAIQGAAFADEITRNGGGWNIEIKKPEQLENALLDLAKVIRNQYVVGFVPKPVDDKSKRESWHKISVKVTVPNGEKPRVVAPKGYYLNVEPK